ncbi:hypothetical protein Cgig2_031780 [Carnegiea gigantea]|uniref:DUF4283 domain-containing protein n=1 Tax=Carnegiea gigantea TaxID=171969 RepID=A0A9Q1GX38_9CARY|nr:hypothetical protein Cgig2_031780 [Carnegiea gigantea]
MKVLIDTNIFNTVEGELILTLGDLGFRVRVKDLHPMTLAIHETNSVPIHPVGAMDSNEGGLEDAWRRLILIEDEEKVVICDDEPPKEWKEYIALCLLGKLLTSTNFNIGAMKSVFKSIWKPSKGVVIKEIEKNVFAFQFFSRYDKEFVMNEGSWAFDGCILLLKQMAGVDIDITKLLRRGVRITADGNPIWIRLKYVRLPDFCYACGKRGRVCNNCKLFNPAVPEAVLQYGGWIRASPLKSKRLNAKEELQEEFKLFLAFRNGKGETKMKKLEFGKEMTEDDNVNQKKKALQEGISKMLSMNSPRNDSLKRKVSMGRPREVEKNRIVDDISQVELANSIQAEVAVQPRREL